MSNFSKAKKYYTSAEVESKTKDLLGKAQLKISEQDTQIASLRVQNEKLSRELKQMKKHERFVSSALKLATEKSDEAICEAKQTRANELDRLLAFSEAYTKKIEALDPKLAKKFATELTQIVQDFKLGVGKGELGRKQELEKARKKLKESADFQKEAQKQLDERYQAVLEKYQALTKKDDDKFSIEEALNPKVSLEEIMNEILKK